MKEIEANKQAWNLLAKDHYIAYKKRLESEESLINPIIEQELGNINGKTLIHLQCNTGADTLSLARMGAKVTGIDIAPDNIIYASMLASDLNINANFLESNILTLMDIHQEKYDIVFTSEGAIGWLNDLDQWAKTIRSLLKDDGFFYVFDSHPFFLTLDEDLLREGKIDFKYGYFDKKPDESEYIGGYASTPKEAKSYFWMYKVSDIINSLIKAGLQLEYFNEHESLFWDNGNMKQVAKGLFVYPTLENYLPYSFSLKATIKK